MPTRVLFGLLVAFCLSGGDWYATTVESLTYPALATQARIEGAVRLALTIGPTGDVTHVDVISGNEVLADAAKSNAFKLKFSMPRTDGMPPRVMEFDYEFRLVGAAERPRTSIRYEHPYRMIVISQAVYLNQGTGEPQ